MRIDDTSPRTWVLAAVAGWAILAWVLALAGMGRRVEPLAADPGLLPPLPAATATTASAPLGPREQYDPIAVRPLFSPDRRPQPFFLQGQAGPGTDKAFDYVLTSVLISPRVKLAILQPAAGGDAVRVRVDQAPESHPAWRLVELGPRSAVFTDGADRRELQLRVFDGQGGQPPTPLGQAGNGARARQAVPPVAPPAVDNAADAAAPPDAVESAAPAPPRPAAPAKVGANPAGSTGAADESKVTADQAQMDAIRKRIEARRAQMREQAQQPKPPGNNR